MALSEDTEALMLAYVYGELSASDARDFERRMSAATPEAAELRAEVESLNASRDLFARDAAFGVKSGVDLPPAHLVDAIMNAEKLSRPAAIRDAALAKVAPPVDKTFTAKLSRWLLGGGIAVGAAAAFFVVVTRSASEPKMEMAAPAAMQAARPAEEPPPPPAPSVFAERKNEGGELATATPATTSPGTGDAPAFDDGLKESAKERDAAAELAPDALSRDARIAQAPAMNRAGDVAGRGRAVLEAAPKPVAKPAALPKAEMNADKKTEEKFESREVETNNGDSDKDRMAGKAGMRSSVGADKSVAGPAGVDVTGGGGGGGGGGLATGAASSGSGSGSGVSALSGATMAPAPARMPTTKRAPADEAEADDVADAPTKVISREELQEKRRNVKKKSVASAPEMKREAERAKRLEQANIALASGQRELAAKRWLGALDQMALAETLDPERALGATPLIGQMRALVELKRPVDAAKVARRLGRWDVRAFDVVPGLLLGAQVAEQIGDDRLARELWTRLLDVPSEKAKARAALDRMERAKAQRRMQFDSEAAEAPASAPASAESKE